VHRQQGIPGVVLPAQEGLQLQPVQALVQLPGLLVQKLKLLGVRGGQLQPLLQLPEASSELADGVQLLPQGL
jgi:hypothetical protein